jgi:mycothiol synthase
MQSPHLTDAAARAAETSGLVVRPYAGEADLHEIVRLTNAELAADGVSERVTVADLEPVYRTPSDGFDARRDVLVAELGGRVAGTVRVDWVDTTDGLREFRSSGWVEPGLRRQGIGARLLAAGQDLIAARAREQATDRPMVLGTWADEKQAGKAALARAAGYEPVRWFFEMERTGIDADLPPVTLLPDGLELRPVGRAEARALWDADHEAFRDHWGGHDDSEANFLRWVDAPEFQPQNFLVAYEGDEIAGAVLNVVYHEENAELGLRRGWLDSVFTRRAWRGRGLARALIVRSFHLLAGLGLDTAALGVDADNPSGALRLYESCGFVVRERGAAWRRPLEIGS